MIERAVDCVIIGGGPAGLAAALSVYQQGVSSCLIVERDTRLGGILNQCIHNGFGLKQFKEELTGPEYSERYIEKINEMKIPYLLNTMVLEIKPDKTVIAVNQEGIIVIRARAVVLAMGCRERPRGALNIPGSRPSGIYTAGTAQKLVNTEGVMPGKETVILGSGDIGLIMARRMTLEGAHVKMVIELMPYSSGLKRNIVQCLDDYGIPLKLNHTVTRIHGNRRLEGVSVCAVDQQRKPIPETETYVSCDTLLLSVGLIPENELTLNITDTLDGATQGPIVNAHYELDKPGFFACGNVLHVHDLVDNVSREAQLTGKYVSEYIAGCLSQSPQISIEVCKGIRYCIPAAVTGNPEEHPVIYYRVDTEYREHYVSLYLDEQRILHQRKRIMTPGEMETMMIPRTLLNPGSEASRIRICVEAE